MKGKKKIAIDAIVDDIRLFLSLPRRTIEKIRWSIPWTLFIMVVSNFDNDIDNAIIKLRWPRTRVRSYELSRIIAHIPRSLAMNPVTSHN